LQYIIVIACIRGKNRHIISIIFVKYENSRSSLSFVTRKNTLDSIEEVGHGDDEHHPGRVAHHLLDVAVGVPPDVAHADEDQANEQPFCDSQQHDHPHREPGGLGPSCTELVGHASTDEALSVSERQSIMQNAVTVVQSPYRRAESERDHPHKGSSVEAVSNTRRAYCLITNNPSNFNETISGFDSFNLIDSTDVSSCGLGRSPESSTMSSNDHISKLQIVCSKELVLSRSEQD
jgi:hypothetical protein